MSFRIRYLLCVRGAYYYAGPAVKQILSSDERLRGVSLKTHADMAAAAKVTGAKLWILREPRRVGTRASRYKRICAERGIGRPKSKKKPELFVAGTTIPTP